MKTVPFFARAWMLGVAISPPASSIPGTHPSWLRMSSAMKRRTRVRVGVGVGVGFDVGVGVKGQVWGQG